MPARHTPPAPPQRHAALLRAVNVGGTGKLPMTDLVAICEGLGFGAVQTYIASGNVVFDSPLPAPRVKAMLEAELLGYAGKPVGVIVRSAAELDAVIAANPFPDAAPNRLLVTFLDAPPPPGAIDAARGRAGERIALGTREIYVDYGGSVGTSRLRLPAAAAGTARNLNTVRRLAAMARAA